MSEVANPEAVADVASAEVAQSPVVHEGAVEAVAVSAELAPEVSEEERLAILAVVAGIWEGFGQTLPAVAEAPAENPADENGAAATEQAPVVANDPSEKPAEEQPLAA